MEDHRTMNGLDAHLDRGLDAYWGDDEPEHEPDWEQIAENRAMRHAPHGEVW
jgi:hypothetical protein